MPVTPFSSRDHRAHVEYRIVTTSREEREERGAREEKEEREEIFKISIFLINEIKIKN